MAKITPANSAMAENGPKKPLAVAFLSISLASETANHWPYSKNAKGFVVLRPKGPSVNPCANRCIEKGVSAR